MGVILPPDRNTPSDTSSDTSSDSNTTKFNFYSNPSIGLKIWGPLTPSPDCLPCLYGLTAFQTIIGISMFRHVRMIWNKTSFISKISKILNFSIGSYLILNSGLEISRLILPYDPWYDEAKFARIEFSKRNNGKNANFWFGDVSFKHMSFKEWSAKIDSWILKTEQLEQEEMEMEMGTGKSEMMNLSFNKQNDQFNDVYNQIKKMNKIRNSEILRNLNTLNKIKEFNQINQYSEINQEFNRPNLNIPLELSIENEDDFEKIWHYNNPWDSLSQDVEYEIRFIPKFRWIDKFGKLDESTNEKEAVNESVDESVDE